MVLFNRYVCVTYCCVFHVCKYVFYCGRLRVHTVLPPAPDVWASPNDTLTENEVVTMQCHVTRANPPAELVWKYDGYMVVTPTSYTLATSWTDSTISIISITASRHDHGRTYACHAHNTLNVDSPISSSISLSVLCTYIISKNYICSGRCINTQGTFYMMEFSVNNCYY